MAIDEEITLKKLEVFLAFMEHGNMARVSELIGQSAVSVHRALHSLEEGLRSPLFKREGRKLVPLPSAYVLLEHARKSIHACEEGVREVRAMGGFHAQRLKLGSLYSLTLRCIPQLLVGLKLRKPGLDIDLTLDSNRELLRMLEDARLDAVVLALREEEIDSRYISVPLFFDDMYFAAPLDSPYAHRTSITLQEVHQEKFMTLGEGFATSRDFNEAFAQAEFAPELVLQVGDIFSLINLVGAGLGYSLLPGRVAPFSSRVQLIALAGSATATPTGAQAQHTKASQQYSGIRQCISLVMLQIRERDPNLLALAAECRMFGRREQHPATHRHMPDARPFSM